MTICSVLMQDNTYKIMLVDNGANVKRKNIFHLQYIVVIYIEEINTWQVSKNVENIRLKTRFFVEKKFAKNA